MSVKIEAFVRAGLAFVPVLPAPFERGQRPSATSLLAARITESMESRRRSAERVCYR